MAMMNDHLLSHNVIDLKHPRFADLPPGSVVVINQDAIGSRWATISTIGARFDLLSTNTRDAMDELINLIDGVLARRRTGPMRPGRHDRGWPKVAHG